MKPPFSSGSAPLQLTDGPLDTGKDTRAYLEADLHTPKLNQLYPFLWLTSLSRPARCLHRQKLLLRTIYVTESPDEHLVWHDASVFIKPLPEYLLEYDFWEQNLCHDEALYKSASGLLLSYSWLVKYKSDLRIAVETGLLPPIEWSSWVSFIMDFTDNIGTTINDQVDRRYHYGDIRLSRLNHLYRFGMAGFSSRNVVFGYMSGSTRYTSFFERNFGWILGVFFYITVILSAMQVALATDKFAGDIQFQQFSYGISLLSIAFVLAAVGAMFLMWASLFWFHLFSTSQYHKKVASQRKVENCNES